MCTGLKKKNPPCSSNASNLSIPKWTLQTDSRLPVPAWLVHSGFSLGLSANLWTFTKCGLSSSWSPTSFSTSITVLVSSFKAVWGLDVFFFSEWISRGSLMCCPLFPSCLFPKHFFLGLSCVGLSLTKPIWLHPSMQRSYPPVGAVYINEDSVTPQGFSQWLLFLQKKKKKKERKKIESVCVACSSKSLAL